MKRFIVGVVTLLMVVSLTACGGKEEPENTVEYTVENTAGVPGDSNAGENSAAEDSPTENLQVENLTEVTEPAGGDGQTDEADESRANSASEGTKVLVAYFSATNTTEGVAELIADVAGAELYEIVPEEMYTDADLDYHDDNSRSSIEMNDADARPAISGSVENMEQYNIVFIGYPIWWGDAPRIMSTFVESYDFYGKTVIPFCTSGGSGIGSSGTNLESLTSGAEWLSGERLNGGSSREQIVEWLNGLGLDITAE